MIVTEPDKLKAQFFMNSRSGHLMITVGHSQASESVDKIFRVLEKGVWVSHDVPLGWALKNWLWENNVATRFTAQYDGIFPRGYIRITVDNLVGAKTLPLILSQAKQQIESK